MPYPTSAGDLLPLSTARPARPCLAPMLSTCHHPRGDVHHHLPPLLTFREAFSIWIQQTAMQLQQGYLASNWTTEW